MESLPITPWFAWSSGQLAQACARLGLDAPSFRSPPAVPGVDRTLRRVRGGGVQVAVRLWGRSFTAIRADMIEGVVAANSAALSRPDDAARVRALLEEVVPVPEGRRAA